MTAGKAILITVGILAVILIAGMVNLLISWIILFGTAGWAAGDAARIGLKKYKVNVAGGPVSIFIGCVLLWIFVFPWYLTIRGKIKRGEVPMRQK